MDNPYEPRSWMKSTLYLTAITKIVFAVIVFTAPQLILDETLSDGQVASSLYFLSSGTVLAVISIGFLVAAKHPYRLWHLTLFGWLAGAFGPLGFLTNLAWSEVALSLPVVFCDLIWWVPFAAIIWGAIRNSHAVATAYQQPEADDPIRELRTNSGKRLDDLADRNPQLVVFLRHAGCTFCRQTLADIQAARRSIEETGCGIVFVHLGSEEESVEVFERYEVDDLPRISDPSCRLYRQFGLDLGGFRDLFGLRVWIRGFVYGVINGHGIGAVKGNSFQMPGVYVYHCGMILHGYRHDAASDRPDYAELARQIEIREPAIAG